MAFGFNIDKSKADIEELISSAVNALSETLTGLINGKADSSHTHAAADITEGTLPVGRGGTGVTSLQALRRAAGLGNTTGAVPVANGGTGATSAAAARTNLGANNASNLSNGTVPRARIESTDWAYMYGSSSSTNYSRWRMVAGIVFVEINYASGAGVGTTGVSFGTIPSGYRPSRLVTAGGYLSKDDDHISSMWVTTAGAVMVAAAASSSTFYGSLSYPLG